MKLFKVISLCLCLIFLLIGCGSEATVNNNENIIDTDNITTEVQDVVESGGAINLSMRNPSTLNPLLNSDASVDRVLNLIFEPLFMLDENQNVIGNIAESYALSNNGKKMTIKLNGDYHWSDGNSVTARDVVYSLDTIKNAPTDSIYKFVTAGMSNYYTLDNRTVVIEYSEAFGGCEYNLCFPIIPRHYYKNKADSNNVMPMGNGSYKVADYRMVRYLTLISDENSKEVPNIKRVNVYIIPDAQTDMEAFEHGITDVLVTDLSSLGRYNSSENISVTTYNSNQFEFLGFNHSLPIFANKGVRQAIAFGIPMDNIVENIYVGEATESLTPVNPNSVLYSKTGVEEYAYNPELAESMLNSTGIDFSAQTFTIMVNEENTERVEIASLIANALAQVGMNVEVERVSFDTYLSRLNNSDFQMFIGGIEFKDRVELSSFLSTGGSVNYFKYSDSQMNTLIDSCYYATDAQSYKKSINGLQKYFAQELPCIGIGFKSKVLLTNSKFKGDKQPILHFPYANMDKWYISVATN